MAAMTETPASGPGVASRAMRKRERCTAEVRRQAILDAAWEVFLERGYAGATIDAVVERAGGSKATVYAQFGNKEGLFVALVMSGAQDFAASIEAAASAGTTFAETLHEIGRRFLGLVLAPERVALYRLVVAESGRLPEVGDIFYRTGPQSVQAHLAEFFRAAAARGLVPPLAPEALAVQFLGSVLGDYHFRVLCNPTRSPTAKEIERHLDFVVPLFLAGARGPAA